MNTDNTHSLPFGDILIVDDNKANLKYLIEILTKAGYDIRPASDGELALRSVKVKLPELILLDYKLPGLDGIEVCLRLKADPETKDIPVIFLSALDETELKVKALQAGGVDYVTKPIEPLEVLARIDTHLKIYHLQKKLEAQSEKLMKEIETRKKAEERNEKTHSLLKAALESTADGILVVAIDGTWSNFNQKYIDMWKIPVSIFESGDDQTALEYVSHSLVNPTEFMNRTIELYGNPERDSIDTLELKDGRIIERYSNPKWLDKKVIGRVWSFRDITERKKAEEVLNQYKYIVSSSTDMLALLDKEFHYLAVNKSYAEAFSLTLEELIGSTVSDVFGEEFFNNIIKPNAERCLDGEKVNYQDWFKFPAYESRYMDITYYPYNNERNEVSGFVVNGRNITEKKQAEEEIKHQLFEKEILLKEVHHRIKNNITSIGGLLALQAQSITNPEGQSALQDAIGRINSMKVLYEKLLLTENYQVTSVREYLENLIDEIISLFPENLNITVQKQIQDFQLDPKRLISIGIIVNELLTNTMKYAFMGRDSGLIQITVKESQGNVTFTIQDNGNGLPEGFDIKTQKGFGLMLVNMLSEQLDGSFYIENNNGARSILEFKI